MSVDRGVRKPGNVGPDGISKADEFLDLKTLFVRSIPLDATDEELADFFSGLAPIKHAVIVKNNEKESRGFGFVSFAVKEDTEEALSKARKTQFKGKLLRVDIARRRDRTKKRAENDITKKRDDVEEADNFGGQAKLIIRNMPWSVRDPEKLKKIFGRFGTVMEAKIPRKPDGKLCGFAFVTMKKVSACKLALEGSKNLKIDGRPVAVDFAVQKSRWENYKKDTPVDEDESDTSSGEADVEEEAGDEEAEGPEDEDEIDGKDGNSDVDLLETSQDEEEETTTANKKSDGGDSKPNRKENFSIFVRNVPYDATSEDLAQHFENFGSVKYALPVLDKETGLAKGTAFVAFKNEQSFRDCVDNAPESANTSLLISDDISPKYVYEGRILAISPTLDRQSAERMSERNATKRKELFGQSPSEKDRRNMFLLNEGRIVEGSKFAQLLSAKDLEIREKSYKLRVQQLKENPSLHLSLTRLAIRNVPRAMTDKSLKALARKAVVEFAKEVKDGKRHPLSKEEIIRSTKEKYKFMDEAEIEALKKKDKKHGVIRQSKIIMEVKGSSVGRSRGYGFVEFRDHKAALMGLRWLNAHEVTLEEVLEGLDEKDQELVTTEGLNKRRLCVEFAIENANVVKRRRDKIKNARDGTKRKRDEGVTVNDEGNDTSSKKQKTEKSDKSILNDDIKRIIGFKRKRKNAGK